MPPSYVKAHLSRAGLIQRIIEPSPRFLFAGAGQRIIGPSGPTLRNTCALSGKEGFGLTA